MSLSLAYKHIELYSLVKKLVQACYQLSQELPEEERNLSGAKLRLAALTAYVLTIQGLNCKVPKKLFQKAQLQLLAVEGLLEIFKEVELISAEKMFEITSLLHRCQDLLKKRKPD